jgi:hypothetical protein
MILVTIIKDNVVYESFSFIDKVMAEQIFSDLIHFYDGSRLQVEDIEDILDDGYCDCSDGFSVCIHHPESDFNNDFLMNVRESI